jgi:hypothetical protein
MEPICLESRPRDFLDGRQIPVGGWRYLQIILGERCFANRIKLRPIDHFDKPEAMLLQQHRFIQSIVHQSTADETNTKFVAPLFKSTEINRSALLANASNFGDLAYWRAENLRIPRYKGEFQVKCGSFYST